MNKLFAITFVAIALSACSSMSDNRSTMGNTAGNPSETKNSSDANKSRNPAAVSPGTGSAAGSSGTR